MFSLSLVLSKDPNDPNISTRLLQRYALALFYYSTHGSNWLTRKYWLTGLHECGWIFVICSDVTNDGEGVSSHDKGVVDVEDDDYSNYAFREPGLNLFDVVTGLSLYGQGLHGTLPTEIILLQHLQVLDLGVRRVVLNLSLPLLNVRLLHLLLHIVVRTAIYRYRITTCKVRYRQNLGNSSD